MKGALYSKGWLMNDGSALARRSSPSGKLTLNLGTPLSDPSVLSDGQAPGRRRRIAFGETSDRSIVVAIEDRAIVCTEREPSEVADGSIRDHHSPTQSQCPDLVFKRLLVKQGRPRKDQFPEVIKNPPNARSPCKRHDLRLTTFKRTCRRLALQPGHDQLTDDFASDTHHRGLWPHESVCQGHESASDSPRLQAGGGWASFHTDHTARSKRLSTCAGTR